MIFPACFTTRFGLNKDLFKRSLKPYNINREKWQAAADLDSENGFEQFGFNVNGGLGPI